MRITDSAHKHGISAEDIAHAYENAIRYVEYEYQGDERALIIGRIAPGICWNWWPYPPTARTGSFMPTGCERSSMTI